MSHKGTGRQFAKITSDRILAMPYDSTPTTQHNSDLDSSSVWSLSKGQRLHEFELERPLFFFELHSPISVCKMGSRAFPHQPCISNVADDGISTEPNPSLLERDSFPNGKRTRTSEQLTKMARRVRWELTLGHASTHSINRAQQAGGGHFST